MASEGIFRFVNFRAAAVRPTGRAPRRTVLYEEGSDSALLDEVRGALRQEMPEEAREAARSFRASGRYVTDGRELEGAEEMMVWFEEHRSEPLSSLEIRRWSLGDEEAERLDDSLLADTINPAGRRPLDREAKVLLRKLLALSQMDGARDSGARPEETVEGWIRRQQVVLPQDLPLPAGMGEAPPAPEEPPPAPPPASSAPSTQALIEAQRDLMRVVKREGSLQAASQDPSAGEGLRLSAGALERLEPNTRQVAQALSLDLGSSNPINIMQEIEGRAQERAAEDDEGTTTRRFLMLGGVNLDLGVLYEALFPGGILFGERDPVLPASPDRCKQSVGVGDLLIVKQEIQAYELGEFAHVQNVLAGETRERTHRRLTRREETFTQEEETTTETERNLQTTERSELQSEAEKTIQTETQLEAGLQISGSYGPTVSFATDVGASFRIHTEEASRKAQSFAREVVEKTAERVRERVRTERVTRLVQESEETNVHAVANPDVENGHIRGIYRWLNKVYDAQVLRYGQRMLFEFVVPEPAAFFLYAMVENPPEHLVLPKPEPPRYEGRPLQPSDLTLATYGRYIAQYEVTGVEPPPPATVTVSHQEHVDREDNPTERGDTRIYGVSHIFRIEPGYEAYGVRYNIALTADDEESFSTRILIGDRAHLDRSSAMVRSYVEVPRTRGELSMTVLFDDVFNYVLGVDVYCARTSEAMSAWQHKTYDAIILAYQQQLVAYQDALRAQQFDSDLPELGRNPLENRRIERNELKKLVLYLMTGGENMGRNVMVNTLGGPIPRVGPACELGSHIQFLENAFEWRNMQYLFYPYFWGRYARWRTALHFTDPDPDFAAFLASGAARVQVPVRPGFEKAIAYYCQFGEPYEGEDPPLIDDDLYVPIVEEITESLGGEDEGVPYPEGAEPWEVRVPTQLVLVQDLEEIPGIRDVLTGSEVSLGA